MGLFITPKLLDMLKQMTGDELKSRRLMSLLKKRGFLQPAFELYGGVAGLYDYGPLGGRLRRKVMQSSVELPLSQPVKSMLIAVDP